MTWSDINIDPLLVIIGIALIVNILLSYLIAVWARKRNLNFSTIFIISSACGAIWGFLIVLFAKRTLG